MKYLLISLSMLVTGCVGSHHGSQQMKGMSMHAKAGSAYVDSVNAALFAGRDLTDEEMDDADNLPGGGYSDGKWTGENPDKCGQYAAQHVWEDEDGTIIILEDDGEITEISML